MANVQLDAQAQKELADLMVELSNDKDFRPVVNKFLKKTSRKVLPDVEMNDIREEMRREREQEKQEREKEKALARLELQRESLKSRYDDKSVEEIESLMQKHGIADYDVGAKLYAADMKPATPSYDANDHKWSLPKFEMKDMDNLKQNTRAKAYQIVDEIKRNRKPA